MGGHLVKHSVRRRLSSDSGISIPFVALTMVVLMGMAALVIDLGNGWRVRRSLIQATDSGALAAAQEFAEGRNGCTNNTGTDYVTFNEPAAFNSNCTPFVYPSGQQGRVTVDTDHNVQTWFASVIGLGDYTVESSTTAVWGPPALITGLRPIGLCFDGSTALQNAMALAPPAETLIRVWYDKDQPDDCGGTNIPGNWGTIDFDGGANSNADTDAWIINGYPDGVAFDDHTVTSCNNEPHCYEGDTGALSGVASSPNSALNQLRASGIFFTLPVFNYVEGNGATALFHLMGAVRVQLVDFNFNGAQSTWYIDLRVKPGLITGTCCGDGGGASNSKIIAICGVDPNATSACDP